MSRAKIAVFVPSLMGGGAERVALFCADSLSRAGYDVDLVVARDVGPLADDPIAKRLAINLGAPNEMLCLPHLLRYLKYHKPDVMIAMIHSAKIMAGLAKIFIRDTPLIISIHNNLNLSNSDHFWVRRYLGFGLERYLYRNVEAAHTVSHALASQVEEFFAIPPHRIHTIYNPLIEKYPISEIPEAHKKWFDKPVIVNAGRLVPQKDHETLINCFHDAKLSGSASLLILGDGPLEMNIKKQVEALGLERDVFMPGRVADIRPYLKLSRGFALSSRFEGLPLVLLEALRENLPIVAYDCPTGPAEALANGTLGRLVAPGDRSGFAEGLRDIVSRNLAPPDNQKTSEQLLKFAPATIDQQYVALVGECLSRLRGDGRRQQWSRPGQTGATAGSGERS